MKKIEGKITIENGIMSYEAKTAIEQTILGEYLDGLTRKGIEIGKKEAIKAIIKNISVEIDKILQ